MQTRESRNKANIIGEVANPSSNMLGQKVKRNEIRKYAKRSLPVRISYLNYLTPSPCKIVASF